MSFGPAATPMLGVLLCMLTACLLNLRLQSPSTKPQRKGPILLTMTLIVGGEILITLYIVQQAVRNAIAAFS